jgi:hypothetical protein
MNIIPNGSGNIQYLTYYIHASAAVADEELVYE